MQQPSAQGERETGQQYADRLLAGHRVAKTRNDAGIQHLEMAHIELSYVSALTHAVLNIVKDIHSPAPSRAAHANENLASAAKKAIALLCLQVEQQEKATASLGAGMKNLAR